MSTRFIPPAPGRSTSIAFPPAAVETLSNGLSVRVIPMTTVPAVTVMLAVLRGTGHDPAEQPGLASLTGDLLDEGAGARDAIGVADAFVRLGAQLTIDVGPDVTSISVSALSRSLDTVFELLADIVIRPHLDEPDFARVRELRLSRLRQLSRSAATAADRVFVNSVFRAHPYGHGSLGTTAALEAFTVDDPRRFWGEMYAPERATLIVGGAIDAADVTRAARRAFGEWAAGPRGGTGVAAVMPPPDPRIFIVNRPGAPQSELRIGHIGPSRNAREYHALVVLNAILGGQYSSRINRRLREERGITYGARTSFDFRLHAGTFSCETSVQADATASAVADVLKELDLIGREEAMNESELSHAKASLTRGYVRHFETASQIVRAAGELVVHGLDAGTFDRFVPEVDAVTTAAISEAGERFVHPADATIVVVGDEASCRAPLEALGRDVVTVTPEF